jgi:hypothetical protein
VEERQVCASTALTRILYTRTHYTGLETSALSTDGTWLLELLMLIRMVSLLEVPLDLVLLSSSSSQGV